MHSRRKGPPVSSIEHALLAVLAVAAGDTSAAQDHLSRAQAANRLRARRERQVVEIAALVVRGDPARAAGLALEHTAEYPDDTSVLAQLTGFAERRALG